MGMSISEVKSVLGNPDTIVVNSIDNDISYYYFMKGQPLLSSGYPEIGFDSLGKVDLISFGE